MTETGEKLPQKSTWRSRIATRWATLANRPLWLRIAVGTLYFVAVFAGVVMAFHGTAAASSFCKALWHFWQGQPTAVEAKLGFLGYVIENFSIAGIALAAALVLACVAGLSWSLYQRDFRTRLWMIVKREVVLAHCMIASAAAVLGGLYYSYLNFAAIDSLRVHVCVAGIVAGVGSTICLGGAMHYLDRVRMAETTEWFLRWPLSLYKRAILLAELGTTGVAVFAAGVLIFGLKIPGVA